MTGPGRAVAEGIARKTSRRGLFGRGATMLFGALAGAAAGVSTRSVTSSLQGTVCAFPGPGGRPCPCDRCNQNGLCAKPCVIVTFFYASGCWVDDGFTCCDCACPDFPNDDFHQWCGCGSDYHNDPAFCPN